MKVRILNKPVGLATLEREWRRLVSEDEPFWKQYNWFYYWWKSRSEEVNLSVFLVEKGETVILIAPLGFERKRAGRPVLRFAANDFPNEFIGDVRLAMPVLLKDLFNRNSFDRLWLRHVRLDSDSA